MQDAVAGCVSAMLGLFFWVSWIFLLARVTMDVSRGQDLDRSDQADCLVFAIVLPFLGARVRDRA